MNGEGAENTKVVFSWVSQDQWDVIHHRHFVDGSGAFAGSSQRRGVSVAKTGQQFSGLQLSTGIAEGPTLEAGPKVYVLRLRSKDDGFAIGILQSILSDEGVTFDFYCVAADITSILENFLPFLGHGISKNTICGASFPKGGGILFRPTRRHVLTN